MKGTLILLHGFGGGPQNLQNLASVFQKDYLQWQIHVPNLYDQKYFQPEKSLEVFCQDFFKYLDALDLPQPIWLFGYSMGGRCALNLLLKNDSRIAGGILFSASPGIFDSKEVESRESWNLQWSEKFQQLSYEDYNRQWNQLPVFEGSEPVDLRRDLPPGVLAKNLMAWSPTRHWFSFEKLMTITDSLVWISGEKDAKYLCLHKDLSSKGVPGRYEVLKGSGHRLPEPVGKGITEMIYKCISDPTGGMP